MSIWAADSHVHFHKCFDEGLFFDYCFYNLNKIKFASVSGGLLFFTEGKDEESYNYLKTKSKINSSLHKRRVYRISPIDNGPAIKVECNEDDKKLLIFPGFQVVTKENLEVLSLGIQERLNDNQPIEDTIKKVVSLGGIPVLPWGFGKWYGNRGKIINEIIAKSEQRFFIGDNGGRTNLLTYPNQFVTARESKIAILPGSDPLPFPNEVKRPLSYGFILHFTIGETNLWESVRSKILDEKFKVESFGNLTTPVKFLKTQLAMQLKKRKQK